MGRRLSAVLFVVAVALAAVTAASARVDADPFLPQEWWLQHIGADITQAPGPGVPIEIVDSGVDQTHPEFAGRPNTTYLNDQTTFGGTEFHGTAVASVAAAPDNGVGLDGVYPNAVLNVYDASPASGGLTNVTATAGVEAAAQHCPAVISLSFGSGDRDQAMSDAIALAQHNGCLVVASSGNEGQTGEPVYPAALPHVLTVGSTDQNDAVTPFSIASASLDLVAPGSDITVAVPTWRNASGYEQESGTSFSAPMVAAAAAWVWTLRPTLSAYQLAQVLRLGAKDLGAPGYDTTYGAGLVSIPGALAVPTPANDPDEPNDDISEVKPGQLLALGAPPLTSPSKPSTRIAGMLDTGEDPRDVYRIWIPAKRVVRVSVSGSAGGAAARIWGPKTVAVGEGLAERRRDLKGPQMTGGKTGVYAFVEVLPTGLSDAARYVLSVTATKK